MNKSVYSALFCSTDPLLVPLEPLMNYNIEAEAFEKREVRAMDAADILTQLHDSGVSGRAVVESLLERTPDPDSELFITLSKLSAYDDDTLWEFLFSLSRDILNAVTPRKAINTTRFKFTPDNIGELIGRCNKIVFLLGAGVSVSANIPDFRSENGIYSTIKGRFPLDRPEDLFNLDFVKSNPFHLFHVFCELPSEMKPTKTHHFLKRLQDENRLLRVYSQNIDCLELQAGLDPSYLVQVHGCLNQFKCASCCTVYNDPEMVANLWKMIRARKAPYCPLCSRILGSESCFDATENYNNILKQKSVKNLEKHLLLPKIVFFNDSIDETFNNLMSYDCDNADLFIVMGTSLSVRPVCGMIGRVPKNIPQIVINKTKPNIPPNFTFDIFCEGDCDAIVGYIDNQLDGIKSPYINYTRGRTDRYDVYRFEKTGEHTANINQQ